MFMSRVDDHPENSLLTLGKEVEHREMIVSPNTHVQARLR